MLGTVEFNSSCFYRYSNIDFDQLMHNLQGDVGLARKTVAAYLQASVEAIPTGKQNSMAAHNPPSLIFAVVRDRGLWSLANAFVKPVWPTGKDSLVQRSIEELAGFWGKLTKVYDAGGVRALAVCTTDEADLGELQNHRIETFTSLIEKVLAALPTMPDGKEDS
jgi:CRISPR system Cascade subunit CasC